MAPRKTPKTPANNGRATVRDVLSAVLGLNGRIDTMSQRIDGTLAGQRHHAEQMNDLHTSMNKLEKTTNARLHEMEASITTLKRPWLFLKSSWRTAGLAAGAASSITAVVLRFLI